MSERVLVTGAAGAIGGAAMALLRERGCRVIGLDLAAEGDEIIVCDVTDPHAVNAAVGEAIERLGGLDVLINNAGVGSPQSATKPPDADALRVIDVNLLGPWRVTAAAMPALRSSRGRVVNVASGLAYLSIPLAAAYCASKRALAAYSDALRLECDAIDVTTVYPGYIRTPIHDAAQAQGVGLEGVVPPESVSEAAATLVRAALGPPVRDLATTRRGAAGYALLRHLPRRLIDAGVRRRLRRAAERGDFDASELAAELRRDLSGAT